jgi:hypothetical protein
MNDAPPGPISQDCERGGGCHENIDIRRPGTPDFWRVQMKVIRRQFLPLAPATLAIAGASTFCWGAEPNVVGNWKLVSYYSQELATGRIRWESIPKDT